MDRGRNACSFQKKVFSPGPETSFQVYFNANTHLLKLRKGLSPRRDAPFRIAYIWYKRLWDLQRKSYIWNDFEHYFEHLTQVMNKPISCLFVLSVVYCVVFSQTLKTTRQQQNKQTNNKQTTKNLRGKQTQQQIQNIQPTTRPRINISQVPAGWVVYFGLYVFSKFFLLFCGCFY